MTDRKQFDQATRVAIWEAHGKRCAYTGEPIDYSELQIDHVVAAEGNQRRISQLKSSGIIPQNFDFNAFENLLPTKGFRNRQKSDFIGNDAQVVFFLGLAGKAKGKAEKILADSVNSDRALSSYLRLKASATKNDVTVEDLLDVLRHQADGEIRLRVAPEVGESEVHRANASIASSLMTKPFALGGGSITSVTLHSHDGGDIVCGNVEEFLDASRKGYVAHTQYEMNAAALAERTAQLLFAIQSAKFAPRSSIRFPRIDFQNLDKWAIEWLTHFSFSEDREATTQTASRYSTLAEAIDAGFILVKTQHEWSLDIGWQYGFSVKLMELFRADLDNDGNEELLIAGVGYPDLGSMRLPQIVIGRPDERGTIRIAKTL
jgi:hypothetical protein